MSVVVPFAGTTEDAAALSRALQTLDVGQADETIVVDNTGRDVTGAVSWPDGTLRVIADAQRSSYHARNVGAERASRDWLLFLDSDVIPSPRLLDAYLAQEIPPDCGIVAGAVAGDRDQAGLITAYARSRRHIDPETYLGAGARPSGVTANLLVRRVAWAEVGGFHEGIRSGGDTEFCWRVQDAGWTLQRSRRAEVLHRHVSTVRAMLRKTARHAGGGAWLHERRPGTFPFPPLIRVLVRAAVGAAVFRARGQRRRAAFKVLDALWHGADAWGRLGANRAQVLRVEGSGDRPVVWFGLPGSDAARSELDLLLGAAMALRVEAGARPASPERVLGRRVSVLYAEDDGWRARWVAFARLAGSAPGRCYHDRRLRGSDGESLLRLAPAVRRLRADDGAHARAASGGDLRRALRVATLAEVPFSADGDVVLAGEVDAAQILALSAFVTCRDATVAAAVRRAAAEAAPHVHVVGGREGDLLRLIERLGD